MMKYQAQFAKDSKILVRGDLWQVERKWDGMRALFELSENETLIFSRTGQDLRPQFPELLNLHERVGIACVLDGEIVAMRPGEPDIEDLELLQLRLGDKLARRATEIPAEVRFFDILESLGVDVRLFRLQERRTLLAQVLSGTEFSTPEILPLGDMIPSHWEGAVSKSLSSVYESGKRRASWSKWKFVSRVTLLVTGLTPGKGSRSDSFGALTVSDAKGVHRGQVGSGFTSNDIEEILDSWELGERILVEVEYRYLSKTGLLVNTAFKGIRDDKVGADS